MYIVITCFREGQNKQYQKICFVNQEEAVTYINEICEVRTIVLFKKDMRKVDRRIKGRRESDRS